MGKESVKNYIKFIGLLLKENAKKAKLEADHPQEDDTSYSTGYLMAYHEVIAILKNRAPTFGLKQEDIGLEDIEPERDLL